MKIALLFNDRGFREQIRDRLLADRHTEVQEYSTAASALVDLVSKPFDLIVMDAVTYPGLGAEDQEINGLAALIPMTQYNAKVLYWQVALRVIHRVYCEESCNRGRPVALRVSDALPSSIGMGDVLSEEAVRKDLERLPRVTMLKAANPEEMAQALLRMM